MSPDEYRYGMTAVEIAARLLVDVDVDAMLAALDRATALGPILDPTLACNALSGAEQVKRLLTAAAPLARLSAQVRDELARA